jgi:NADH-quinone oxidoreductase subunit A
MNSPYIPVLILLGVAAFTAFGMIGASHLLSPHRPTPTKDAPYESGMPPLGNAHERFSVQFRMVAMLFIIFDIETVFLIPWGAIYWNGGLEGGPGTGFLLAEMAVFMFVLAVGYVYVWKRGALQWD